MGAGTALAAGSNVGGRCRSSSVDDVKVVDNFGNQPKLHDGMVGRNVLILDAGNCMAKPRFLHHETQILLSRVMGADFGPRASGKMLVPNPSC